VFRRGWKKTRIHPRRRHATSSSSSSSSSCSSSSFSSSSYLYLLSALVNKKKRGEAPKRKTEAAGALVLFCLMIATMAWMVFVGWCAID